jgi:Domain of unknown function (DUF6046)
MPLPSDFDINENTNKIGRTTGKAGGFIDGITNDIEGKGNASLNLATKAKGIFDGSEKSKIEKRYTSDGRRLIELGKRFQNAFGFVGGNVGASLQETNFTDSLTGAKVMVDDGRSSYEEFTLKRPGLELKFGYSGLIKQLDNVFAPPALVSFKREKRIDETIVSSNDANGEELEFGQVVENYGRKPIDITIKGILVDMVYHQYPSNKIRQLIDLFDYNGVWEVEGQIFIDHRIKSIYFMSLDDEPVQGFMDTWSYTISARSIKPVEYFLK